MIQNQRRLGHPCQISRPRHCRPFEGQDHLWHYMYDGPFSSSAQFHRWVRDVAAKDDPLFYAIKNLDTGNIEGVASYLRIAPEAGSIEVGSITFSPALQRTRCATDAEWPGLKEAFEAWLAPSNFDDAGMQRERLGDLTGLVRVASDPLL